MLAWLGTIAAVFIVVLVLGGIFAMIQQMVAGRRRETGIRMALGASPSKIVSLFAQGTLVSALLGLLLGSLAVWILQSSLQSLLFQMSSLPLGAWLATVLGFFLVCTLAALIPANRAARMDVVEVLRDG